LFHQSRTPNFSLVFLVKKKKRTVTVVVPVFRFALPHGPRRSDATIQRRIAHALHNGLAQGVHFGRIVTSKGRCNGGTVVHPPLQFELPYHLVAVALGAALRDLVAADVGLVEIVDEIDGQFDEKIAFRLYEIGIVEPVVKVGLRTEPEHRVGSVLHPKGLLPLFHDNGAKGNAREHKALFLDQFSFGKG